MSLRRKYIDGEQVFRTYCAMPDEKRSTTELAKGFPKNPRTGEKFTEDAGYKAMWRWACRPENEELGYKIFLKTSFGRDPEWTKERWHAELAEKARWALTPAQYQEWYPEFAARNHNHSRHHAQAAH